MWGTSTSALGALGYDKSWTNTANTASWDGTSWTEVADLANARNGAQTGGIGSDNTDSFSSWWRQSLEKILQKNGGSHLQQQLS